MQMVGISLPCVQPVVTVGKTHSYVMFNQTMKSQNLKYFSSFILAISFMAFVYGVGKALDKVDKTQLSTNDGVYTSYVSTTSLMKYQVEKLTKECTSKVCQVQKILDFVTDIPYHTNTFQQVKPLQIIEQNFGDCDDKSNLLISLLHSLEIEAYFVLVPKHIFVIVFLDAKELRHKKGLWVNGKKYYILESTAKGSSLGYPLHYRLGQINTIIEPFSNKKINIKELKYAK